MTRASDGACSGLRHTFTISTRSDRSKRPSNLEIDDTIEAAGPDSDLGAELEADSDADTVADEPGTGVETALCRGDELGRYVVLELLGRGGMGEVYAAYDPELDRRVAVKVIHAAMRASSSPQKARARLLREAQTLAKLSHPNVVAVYDVGELESDVYVAMEFVEGLDLRGWIELQERSPEEVLEVFLDAARGLGSAHEAGLAHRDFKPENVLIGSDGRVRVIDFGIARLTSEADDGTGPAEVVNPGSSDALIDQLSSARKISSTLETRAGQLIGTPAYMAPEQFLGGAADARSDQFSFCVALWEALVGERPFAGKNVADLSASVLEGDRRPLPVGARVPAHVARGLDRGLANRPDDRFPDMIDLVAAMTQPPSRGNSPLVFAAMIAAAAVATVAVVYGVTTNASENPCAAVGDEAASIWTAARRSRAQAAFAATGDRNAGEAWVRVASSLDDYATGWAAARRDVCEASQVRKEQSAELSEKRIVCLDERLGELRAVVALVETATAPFVEDAVETVGSMGRLEECSNIARLGSPRVPSELTEVIATLKTLNSSRQLDKGLEVATFALLRANDLGSRAGAARIQVELARLYGRRGDHGEALEGYFKAIRLADEAKDTRTEAEAWIDIVRLVGGQQQRFGEARRWAEHAALAIRQDGSALELEGRLQSNIAWVDRTRGDHVEALAGFRRALELYREVGGMQVEELRARAGVASALRSLERHDEALALQQEVLAARIELYGENDPRMSSTHSSLATSLTAVKRYAEAREQYELAVALHIQRSGPDDPGQAWTIRDLGLLEERIGDYQAARERYARVLELRRARHGDGHPRALVALARLGRIARRTGDTSTALSIQRQVVSGLRAAGDDARSELGKALGDLCEVRRRVRDLRGAANACDEALETLGKDSPDPRDLATALTRAARVDLELGRDEQASASAERALDIRRAHLSDAGAMTETLYVAARARLSNRETRRTVRGLLAEIDGLSRAVHRGEDELGDALDELREQVGR